jgi:hypothetical protein
MLVALLAVLGVDLIVIVVLLAAMLTRRRWVSHQPGAFEGAIRAVDVKYLGWDSNGSAATTSWRSTGLPERHGQPSPVRSSGWGRTP